MAELIALHQIVTREKKGGPRIIIPANSRFDTADYPMIGEDEWNSMMSGTPQIVRTPDDPAFVTPQQQRAAANAPVTEGRSPRTDIGDRAPARTEGGVTRAVAVAEDEDEDEDEGQPQPARSRRRTRRTADEDEDDI